MSENGDVVSGRMTGTSKWRPSRMNEEDEEKEEEEDEQVAKRAKN